MGFYIRKALSVGPLRFNLSKSGVGVSAGIRGLRFGTGPRGNYVHMGRGGFYFRKTLASGQRSPLPVPRQETARPGREVGFAELLKDIESGSALDMTDSSAAELLEELNSKRRLTPFLPFAVALAVILVLSAVLAVIRGGSWWISALLAVAGVSLVRRHVN
jgi:hypothetical protein